MANREGVVSSVGYLALYLSGVSWGQNLIEKSKSVKDKVKQFAILGNIFMVLLYLFLPSVLIPSEELIGP